MCEIANSMSHSSSMSGVPLFPMGMVKPYTAPNGLINFMEKDKDLYRIRFVKEET